MRIVQLEYIEACLKRAAGRSNKIGTDLDDAVYIKGGGQQPAVGHRTRAGRHHFPRGLTACRVRVVQGSVAFKSALDARFRPRMANLDARRGAIGLGKGGDACQAGNVCVVPQAQVAMRDPSFGRYGGRLDHHQAEAAQRETAVVDGVVVACVAVFCRVLAHRAQGIAVAQGDTAQCQGFKDFAHGSFFEKCLV